MKEKHIGRDESKGIFYDRLEEFARAKIQQHLQDLLEQEVSEWLGRAKSERKLNPLEQPGYRNGYGLFILPPNFFQLFLRAFCVFV